MYPDTPGNPLGGDGEGRRRHGPIPSPGRPEPEPAKASEPESNGTEPAPQAASSIDAAALAALIATSDQHSAEIDALARAQRLQQRNLLLLSAVAAYLLWRARPNIGEGVRNAVAGPVTPQS